MRLLIAFLVSLLVALPAAAQLPAHNKEAGKEAPRDPLGRSTPRGAIQGFLAALAEGDEVRAARYLSTTGDTPFERRIKARNLRLVLDRSGELLPTPEIANVPEGKLEDGLDPALDRIGQLGSDSVRGDLLMRRTSEGGADVWLVAPETLTRLPAQVAASRAGLIERWTPTALADLSLVGVAAGDWLAVAVVAVAAVLVGQALSWLLRLVATTLWARTGEGRHGRWLYAARWPLGLSFAVAIFKGATLALGVSVVARELAGRWADIAAAVAIVWLLFTIVDHASNVVMMRAAGRARQSAVSAIQLLRRLAKAVLVMFGLMIVLDIFGVDVTTWLAALGIGGLALALGAQKTIENLVGSVTLVADQPIRIGDFCRFGTTLGTVEDIGMRSTRIRTLEQTLVTIPNGAFSSMEIENYAKRERFLFKHALGLRYETSADAVERACEAVRRILREHPAMIVEGSRVRFTGLGADSLTVEIFAYGNAQDYPAFLGVQEKLLLAIMRAFEREGVEFAFPSQTVYLARDTKRSAPPAVLRAA